MARLKAALIREYEDNDEVHIEVHNPRNTEAVTLNFRGEKLAKVKRLWFRILSMSFLQRNTYFLRKSTSFSPSQDNVLNGDVFLLSIQEIILTAKASSGSDSFSHMENVQINVELDSF